MTIVILLFTDNSRVIGSAFFLGRLVLWLRMMFFLGGVRFGVFRMFAGRFVASMRDVGASRAVSGLGRSGIIITFLFYLFLLLLLFAVKKSNGNFQGFLLKVRKLGLVSIVVGRLHRLLGMVNSLKEGVRIRQRLRMVKKLR